MNARNFKFKKYLLTGPLPLVTSILFFAATDVHASPLKTGQVSAIISKADSLRVAGNYKEAEKAYKQALKLSPESIEALRGLGYIAFEKPDLGDVKKWNQKILEIEPNDLEAKYYLGIAYRETGKFKALLLRKIDFGKSERYFDDVISVDSTFEDIFYQRGLLERWREHWTEAIEWGHRQVALKPEMMSSQVGLYKLYRLFLMNKDDKDVVNWLSGQDGDWAAYFLGEQHRREKRFAQADSIFQYLLQKKLDISKTPVYLSLVRLYIQQNEEARANSYFQSALDSINANFDAEFLLEDCKYIFKDEELQQFRKLTVPAEKRAFFARFWALRNPTLAAQVNVRALEHFRRLIFAEENYWYDGVRSWVNNPDEVGYLQFPEVYYLNQEFNDKGLIYIRHGEPNDIALTGGQLASNESWHYYSRQDRPEYIFHFLISQFGAGHNWRLVPYITDRRILADRLGWDPGLDRLYYANSQIEFNSVLEQVALESTETVRQAMSSDFHTWDKETKFFEFPYTITNFRGSDGKTRVEISYALPLEEISQNTDATGDIFLEHGAAFYDTFWNEKGKYNGNFPLNEIDSTRIFRNHYIHRNVFHLAPQAYHLAIHARTDEPPKIGGWNEQVDIPSFEQSELTLSDLELAFEIAPEEQQAIFQKENLSVVPNPTRGFLLSEAVYLYYEIYNLSKAEDGVTSFEIENVMTQLKKKKGGLGKLFGFLGGGKKKILSIQEKRQGRARTAIEYACFDVSKLDEGEYELSVKVKDLNSGATAESSVRLTLRK